MPRPARPSSPPIERRPPLRPGVERLEGRRLLAAIDLDHPLEFTLVEGDSATLAVEVHYPAPSLIRNQWERAEGGSSVFLAIPGATGTSFDVTDVQLADQGARYRVRTDITFYGLNVGPPDYGVYHTSMISSEATLVVVPDQSPTASISIDAGLADGKYLAGQAIRFSAAATDVEDGPLDVANLTYRVDQVIGPAGGAQVVRSILPETPGQAGGSFTPDVSGPGASPDSVYRITVTATDSRGHATTIARDLAPALATLTVTTVPEGLAVLVDGVSHVSPYAFAAVVGSAHEISAAPTLATDPGPATFGAWSDGGDPTHIVAAPASDATYVATYDVPTPPPPPPPTPPRRPVAGDYDGDGRADIAAYLPALGVLAYRPTGGGPDVLVPFGAAGPGQTLPAQGDYDGDGRADIAAYLPPPGVYAYRPSGGGPDVVLAFGAAGAGASIPVPGDYFGAGHDEAAVYLPTNGVFAIRPAGGGPDGIVPFGFAGAGLTLPAVGDYDGDGRADIAAYLPTLGVFAIRRSSGGPDTLIPFGLPGVGGSIPVPGDFDGDGKTDIAVFMPSLGTFAYRPSGGGPDVQTPFGTAGDGSIPTPGDYSGSGRAEVAIFHPATASFAYRPTGGGDVIVPFGMAGSEATLPTTEPPGSRAEVSRTSARVEAMAVPASRVAPSRPTTVSPRAALPRRPAIALPLRTTTTADRV